VTNNLIYTPYQYDALQDQCLYHAAFAYLDDYGKQERDLIQWLSNHRIPFNKALDDLEAYLFRYIKKLNSSADL
jgi:hypothetical protein